MQLKILLNQPNCIIKKRLTINHNVKNYKGKQENTILFFYFKMLHLIQCVRCRFFPPEQLELSNQSISNKNY